MRRYEWLRWPTAQHKSTRRDYRRPRKKSARTATTCHPAGRRTRRRHQTMGRPALHVHVRLGVDIEIITTHFKSKLLTFPGVRFSPHDEAERGRFAAYALYGRSAEATTVRAAATDRLTGQPQRAAVVLGDLNDEVEAATTQIVNGPPGSEIGTTGFDRPDNGDAQRLWNLARASLPRNDLAESTEDA